MEADLLSADHSPLLDEIEITYGVEEWGAIAALSQRLNQVLLRKLAVQNSRSQIIMLDEQEDESLGLETLPQTELDAMPSGGEKPDSEPEGQHNLEGEQKQVNSTESSQNDNRSQAD